MALLGHWPATFPCMELFVRNTTAERIPPGGAMEPMGQADADGIIDIRKPTRSSGFGVYVNGPTSIEPNGVGVGSLPWAFGVGSAPIAIAVDPLAPTAAEYGTKAGSWLFDPNQYGFVPVAQSYMGLVNAIPSPGGSSSGVWVVALAFVSASDPTGCAEAESDIEPNCWPKYQYAVIAEYDAACNTWTYGDCVFLTSGTGPQPELNKPYRAWPAGSVPSTVSAAGVPVGLPCDYGETTPLYQCDVGDVSRVITIGAAVEAWCGESPTDELLVYEGQSIVLDACGQEAIEDVLIADINGCTSAPGTKVVADYQRMIRDDVSGGDGTGRACRPLFVYKREKNQQIDVRCEGGVLKVYVPDEPCGDTLVYAHSAGCCNCNGEPTTDPPGDGEPGGSASCCSRALNATLYVPVPGGTLAITWDAGNNRWEGNAALSCGEQLFLRFSTACVLSFSCNGATFVPAAAGIGDTTCGPPYVSGPWTINMDDTGSPGCVTGACPSFNTTVIE